MKKKNLINSLMIAFVTSGSAYAGVDLGKIDATFNELDNNKDDRISMEEADDNDIWEHFSLIDGNTDLHVDRDEYGAYMKNNVGIVADNDDLVTSAAEPHDREKIDHTFEELDNNSNGLISVEEADDDSIIEHFTLIDKNRDMKLDRSEFDSYIKKYGIEVADEDVAEGVAAR